MQCCDTENACLLKTGVLHSCKTPVIVTLSWKTHAIPLEFRPAWIYSWNFIIVLEKLLEYCMNTSHE